MKKFTLIDGIALIIWLLPSVYLLSVYSSLPALVPLHYGAGGKVDRYGSPEEFRKFQVLMTGISLFVYLLLRFILLIDPKKQVKFGEDTFKKIALGILAFLTALNMVIIYATAHIGFKIEQMLYPLIGLMFVFLGNMMTSVKPNYFVGVRTPWTLEDQDSWGATHRLGGKLWFGGGLIITIAMFFIQGKTATYIFVAGMIVLALVPVVYSYIYFKKKTK